MNREKTKSEYGMSNRTERFTFDPRYRPSKRVKESAELLASYGYNVGDCSEHCLFPVVNYIKRVAGTTELIINYDCWVTLGSEVWEKPDHVRCYTHTVWIEQDTLLLDEIDDQFGIADWIDIEIGGYIDVSVDSDEVPEIVRTLYLDWLKEYFLEFEDARDYNGPRWFKKLSLTAKRAYAIGKVKNEKRKRRQLAERKRSLNISTHPRPKDAMYEAGWWVNLGREKDGTFRVFFEKRSMENAPVGRLKPIRGIRKAKQLVAVLRSVWNDVAGKPLSSNTLLDIAQTVKGTHPHFGRALYKYAVDTRPPFDERLAEIYSKAEYHVLGEKPFVMRVGQYCPELAELNNQTGSTGSFFITAYNPLSIPTAPAENEAAHARLLQNIGSQPAIEGFGKAADGTWPEEKSLLVLQQTDPSFAYALARMYEQVAFLWCPESAVPMLLMTDDLDTELSFRLDAMQKYKAASAA
jgi:Protein of unknown function (DUF3293)